MPTNSSKNLPSQLFVFGLAFAFFHIAPVFLNFEIRDKLMVADVFDLATPLVMVFLVLKLVFSPGETALSQHPAGIKWLLFLGVVIFVEGHGIHLSANAIHRTLTSDMPPTLLSLTNFFDERLGHILWDSGNILLALAILTGNWRSESPALSPKQKFLIITGSACYGFTFFANAVEGQTVIFTLPYSALLFLVFCYLNRKGKWNAAKTPAVLFFWVAAAVSLFFFTLWFVWQGGFPEFSALGWI